MAARAALPALLLCALLLLLLPPQIQGGPRGRRRAHEPQQTLEIKVCEKSPIPYMCNRQCTVDKECQANNICCSTYCGKVCMSLL
ncbi:WAP four-disulfide core domain protein 10A-like [Tamandua tetradactyla]|uniref:WAP four-disulfide core domain protein 10A-like n=1 Tax=Tamandua tetradactyla TaxID=48850 RepID=UPI004053C162